MFLYAGSILPGRAKLSDGTERDVTIIDAFEAVGACARGLMPRADVDAIERAICPGEGACGGMYTANTMACAAEALGMSLPGSAAPPATDRRRDGFARRSGQAVVELLRRGITARDILTKEAFENAIAVVMAFGGSTNAVLHLLAIAHEADVELSLEDFSRIGSRVPHLADVKPFGRHVMSDVDHIGGVPVVMKALLDAGLLHGDCLTVTGQTMAENLAAIAPPDPDGKVLRALDNPIHPTGGITILRGSLAPDGAVVKIGRLRLRRVRRHRKGFRRRAGRAGRPRGRHHHQGRRRRDPLRRPQGRPRDARNARHHRRDQRRRPGQGRSAAYRRPVLRRNHRPVCGTHRARGGRRRTDRASCATATGSGSTSPSGTLDVLADADRIRFPARGFRSSPAALQNRRAGQVRQAGQLGRDRRGLRLAPVAARSAASRHALSRSAPTAATAPTRTRNRPSAWPRPSGAPPCPAAGARPSPASPARRLDSGVVGLRLQDPAVTNDVVHHDD